MNVFLGDPKLSTLHLLIPALNSLTTFSRVTNYTLRFTHYALQQRFRLIQITLQGEMFCVVVLWSVVLGLSGSLKTKIRSQKQALEEASARN